MLPCGAVTWVRDFDVLRVRVACSVVASYVFGFLIYLADRCRDLYFSVFRVRVGCSVVASCVSGANFSRVLMSVEVSNASLRRIAVL